MMRSFNALGFGLLALAGFGACSDGGNTTPDQPGKRLEVNVAPLNLANIGVACYDIEVHALANGAGDLVWSQGIGTNAPQVTLAGAEAEGAICSDRYGNAQGGDIAYVGPCDAQPNGHNNSVTIWVENLYYSNGDQLDPGEWDNPYDEFSGGSTYNFPCFENQDSPVIFNIVIMRDANQGFFDVAVNFANVFCSGKIDTCDAGGKDINLLFTPGGAGAAAGKRTKTAVIAFACTGGTDNAGNNNTILYADDLNLTCAGGFQQNLTLTNAEGQQINGGQDDGLIQWALYRGQESLNCDGEGSCNKMYWNTAIALNPDNLTGKNCTVQGEFTVGSEEDSALAFSGAGPFWTPGFTRYPTLNYNVQLTNDGGWVDNGGDGACVNVQLGQAGFDVNYTPPGSFAQGGGCFDGRYTTDPNLVDADNETAHGDCP